VKHTTIKLLKQQNQKLDKLLQDFESQTLAPLLLTVFLELLDEICLEVCFEMHKKLKLQLLCLNCDSVYSDVVCRSGCDIFGQTPNDIQNNTEAFECVNCKRTVMAGRYAPHLEKCMGLGRSSSRIANKRLAISVDRLKNPLNGNDSEQSDNEDRDYFPQLNVKASIPSRKDRISGKISSKKLKTKSISIDSSEHTFDKPSTNRIKELLNTTCGVISSSTGKMCTKTLNCPQHNDQLREDIRLQLLGKRVNMNELREMQLAKKQDLLKLKKHSLLNVKKQITPVLSESKLKSFESELDLLLLNDNSQILSDNSPEYVDVDGVCQYWMLE